MARPPQVDHVRDSFISEAGSAENLLTAIDALPRRVDPTEKVGIQGRSGQQTLAFFEDPFLFRDGLDDGERHVLDGRGALQAAAPDIGVQGGGAKRAGEIAEYRP